METSNITQAELGVWVTMIQDEVRAIRKEYTDSIEAIKAEFEQRMKDNREAYKEYTEKTQKHCLELDQQNDVRFRMAEESANQRNELAIAASDRNMKMLAVATMYPRNQYIDLYGTVNNVNQIRSNI